MADNTTDESSLFHNISQQLTCSICLDHYQIPKTLPCLHTFCQNCLQQMIESTAVRNGTKGTFPCPKCRVNVEFDYPSLNAARPFIAKRRFKTNFDIQSQVEAIQKQLKMGCQQHSGETLMFFCKTCSLSACSLCLTQTHLPKNHNVSSIQCEADSIRKACQKKQILVKEKQTNLTEELLQSQNYLEKLEKRKTNAHDMIKVLIKGINLIEEFITDIEEYQCKANEAAGQIYKFNESYAKLEDIVGGSDLQVVDGKKKAESILEELFSGCKDISLPIRCEFQELSDIHDTIVRHLDALTNGKDVKEIEETEEYELYSARKVTEAAGS